MSNISTIKKPKVEFPVATPDRTEAQAIRHEIDTIRMSLILATHAVKEPGFRMVRVRLEYTP